MSHFHQTVAMKQNHAVFLAEKETGFPIMFLADSKMLIVDIGTSITIMSNKRDFDGHVQQVQPTELKDIASSLWIKGTGTATYAFLKWQKNTRNPTNYTLGPELYS
jgi:hypothetical protein